MQWLLHPNRILNLTAKIRSYQYPHYEIAQLQLPTPLPISPFVHSSKTNKIIKQAKTDNQWTGKLKGICYKKNDTKLYALIKEKSRYSVVTDQSAIGNGYITAVTSDSVTITFNENEKNRASSRLYARFCLTHSLSS